MIDKEKTEAAMKHYAVWQLVLLFLLGVVLLPLLLVRGLARWLVREVANLFAAK